MTTPRLTLHNTGEHHAFILPAVTSLLPNRNCELLDAGCGPGRVSSELAALGHWVTGIEQDPEIVVAARRNYPNVRFEARSVYDNLSDLAPPDGWDVIVSCEVIEHLYEPLQFLRNMRMHLKPTGLLILTTPYHGYWKNLALAVTGQWDWHHTSLVEGGHIKFFSPQSITAALEMSGFGKPEFRNVGRIPY